MKREKIYCLLSAFVISILLIILTLKFTSIDVDAIIIINIYFALTFAVLIFIFAIFGIIQLIKNITYIFFLLTFIMLPLFCGLWSKYKKNQK